MNEPSPWNNGPQQGTGQHPGNGLRLVSWWRRQSRGKKIVIGVVSGIVVLGAIGSFTDPPPKQDGNKGTTQPSVSVPPVSEPSSPEPSASAAPLCNAKGDTPKAPDASGPLSHVRLGKLTCKFDTAGKLDDAAVPVTVKNDGKETADYTITVELLDASDSVVKTNDLTNVYGLEPGKSDTSSAVLVGWGEAIETDGKGYKTRVSVVEREAEEPPSPLPTDATSSGGSGGVDVPNTITPGAFCGKAGAVGFSSKGRMYTCIDGHWRR